MAALCLNLAPTWVASLTPHTGRLVSLMRFEVRGLLCAAGMGPSRRLCAGCCCFGPALRLLGGKLDVACAWLLRLGAQMPDQGATLLLQLQGCLLIVQRATHCGCAGPGVTCLCV